MRTGRLISFNAKQQALDPKQVRRAFALPAVMTAFRQNPHAGNTDCYMTFASLWESVQYNYHFRSILHQKQ